MDYIKGKELTMEEVKEIIGDTKVNSVVYEIKGILKHVKDKTSVELQHEASKLRAKRVQC